MQLTQFSDLSLRLLMYLASREDPMTATVTARQASAYFQVPYTHMVKVVHHLGRGGILVTSKGKGGGVRLAQLPAQMRIGNILRRTETNKSLVNCAKPACPLRNNCLLKGALDQAYETFFENLNRYTLADVARTPALQSLVTLSVS